MQALKKGTYRIEPGEYYGTPKELWGFRTRASSTPPRTLAKQMLTANHELLGLDMNIQDLKVVRTIHSLGAKHIFFQQRYAGKRIHRAYVTVHFDTKNRIYLVKNRAVPGNKLPRDTAFTLTQAKAESRAKSTLRYKSRTISVADAEPMWFPQGKSLEPAWRIRMTVHRPREEWTIFIHARTGEILSRYDNLALAPTGRGFIFNPSPVTALGNHEALLTKKRAYKKVPEAAYHAVKLRDLDNSGYLDGKRVTTRATKKKRIRRADHHYEIKSDQDGFEQVMAYHHINEAIRYLEQLGYRGKKAIFRKPIAVNATGTTDDQSWYSPHDKQLTFGTGYIDDAEDAETILHELGHAIQDAICPNFGQSLEAAALGEGFGDYFAASYFAEHKPNKYQHCVMTWDGLLIGLEEALDPPCLRQLKNKHTYEDFVAKEEYEHSNGEIWSATLWNIRELLGRDIADRIIIESHFQLDGFTTFARAARAIIDADRNLYQGKHKIKLAKIFQGRRIKVN
ncbi:MAG TPA: M36 family metallopeptidase [Gammaproteobacteria bacterium]